MNMKICSTIGYERRHNPTLAIEDEEQFVAEAVAKLGPQPPNFEKIVALNRGPLLTAASRCLRSTPTRSSSSATRGPC